MPAWLRRSLQTADMPRLRFGASARPEGKIRTVAGLWLRALLAWDTEARRALAGRLNGGQQGWNYDEPAVMEAACELAVRRFFGSGYDVREITAAVSWMRSANQDRGRTSHGQLEMEAVIRSALGEPDVDISGIIPPVLMEIRIAALGYAILKLGLSQPDIAKLIVEAENVAFKQGWNPPLS
jgi:hypothetical protein